MTTLCFIFVAGASPPTNLTADPDGPTSIKISWIPPTSRVTVTGYQIFYRMLGSITNYGSVDIAANKKQHTLYNLLGGFVYVITMVTKSQHLPSTVVGPIRATLGKIIQKGRMTFVYIHYLLSPTVFLQLW